MYNNVQCQLRTFSDTATGANVVAAAEENITVTDVFMKCHRIPEE
jgi:hypothetical protein